MFHSFRYRKRRPPRRVGKLAGRYCFLVRGWSDHPGVRLLDSKLTVKNAKARKRILANSAAVLAMPPKPNASPIRATTRNDIEELSMDGFRSPIRLQFRGQTASRLEGRVWHNCVCAAE